MPTTTRERVSGTSPLMGITTTRPTTLSKNISSATTREEGSHAVCPSLWQAVVMKLHELRHLLVVTTGTLAPKVDVLPTLGAMELPLSASPDLDWRPNCKLTVVDLNTLSVCCFMICVKFCGIIRAGVSVAAALDHLCTTLEYINAKTLSGGVLLNLTWVLAIFKLQLGALLHFSIIGLDCQALRWIFEPVNLAVCVVQHKLLVYGIGSYTTSGKPKVLCVRLSDLNAQWTACDWPRMRATAIQETLW